MSDFNYRQNYLRNLALNLGEMTTLAGPKSEITLREAAEEIEKLARYEGLTLVQGREAGADDDEVAFIETPNGESATNLFMTQVLGLPEEARNDTLVIVSENYLFNEFKQIVTPWRQVVYTDIRMYNPRHRGQPVGTFKPILVRGFDGEREELVDVVRFKFIRDASDAEEMLDFELFPSVEAGVLKLLSIGWITLENNGDTCMTMTKKAEL